MDTYRVASKELKIDLLLRSKVLSSAIHQSSMIANNMQELELVAEKILSSNPAINTLIILSADNSRAVYEVHTKSYSKEVSMLLKHAAKSVLKSTDPSARLVENNSLFSIVPSNAPLKKKISNSKADTQHQHSSRDSSLKGHHKEPASSAKVSLHEPKTLTENNSTESVAHAGAVLFAFDQQMIQSDIFALLWRILPTTLTGVSLMILLCYLFLHMLVIKPLSAIKVTMLLQQNGVESARAPAQSSIEIDVMSKTLNRMLDTMREHENVIKAMAMTDSLTGLANRTLFQSKLEQAIKQAVLQQQRFAVFYIDLDKFKLVNDQYGHLAGDKMLKEAAKVLTDHTREMDTVARLGGDEFAIIALQATDITAIQLRLENIISGIAWACHFSDSDINTGASIGVAFYPNDALEPDELMKRADSALYQAKSEGRGVYHFYCEKTA
ncbi:MAG: hypothetical protein OFPI_07560 [Osedax symbiont Rs2]|nr:MAG: hypothetical protein OFPI_07560 [Osedax symbiont Rs2]